MRFYILPNLHLIFLIYWGPIRCIGKITNIPNMSHPNMTIGFIHMHKAGGSTMIKTFEEMLKQLNCFTDPETGIKGRQNAPSRHHYCHWLRYCHNEFDLLDGKQLLSFPTRSERLSKNIYFSIITQLRHPINRFCSTAFFHDSFVPTLFVSNLHKFCGEEYSNPTHACNIQKQENCTCYNLIWNQIKESVRHNETLWYQWMSGRMDTSNSYVPNYYVRRLAWFENDEKQKQKVEEARKCLETPGCDDTNLIQTILSGDKSKAKIKPEHLPPFTYSRLQIAKRLLSEQFDFVILEQSDTIAYRRALETAMFGNIKLEKVIQANKGILTRDVEEKEREKCTDLIPPSVLDRMEEENTIDLEFYYYAVNLFRQRAEASRWYKED